MKRSTRTIATLGAASALMLAFGAINLTWANEPGYGKYGHGSGHGGKWSYGRSMMHRGTGHLIRHLLKHEKDIGLTADQVAKLKDIQLDLDRARIKAEAEIQIAERELKALTDDEQSDLVAIEAKLRQSKDLRVGLRMTSIKTRREVLGLLTPEQRDREKTGHDKMMQQHKGGGKGHGYPHGGMMPHSAGPYGKNPHGGYGNAVSPTPPGNTYVQ